MQIHIISPIVCRPETIDFRKTVWPKFCSLLRNAFNRNAQAICPNILPFFSQLSHVTDNTAEYQDFVKQFFDNLKILIENEQAINISKQDSNIIIKTYFECLRYLMQKINNASKDGGVTSDDIEFAVTILEKNLMSTLKWCLSSTNGVITRYFFQQSSTLVAFFDKQQSNAQLYPKLLDTFWSSLFNVTLEDLKQQDVQELYVERVIGLINDLYVANPCLEEHKVKFIEPCTDNNINENDEKDKAHARPVTPKEAHTTAAFRQKELKQLVLQLLRICLQKTLTLKTSKYAKHVRLLCNMFNDKEFFAKLSENNTLEGTLTIFTDLLNACFMNDDACEIVMDVIFEILQQMEKKTRFEFIEQTLLKVRYLCT